MIDLIKKYFHISGGDLETNNPEIWKTSILRIILVSSLLLVSVITAHSCCYAYLSKAWFVFIIDFIFIGLTFFLLLIPREKLGLSSLFFIFIVILAAFCIFFFVRDKDVASLGILVLYSLPIFARIFFGLKSAVFFMVLNIAGFLLISSNIESPNIFNIQITLKHADKYIHGLIFLFFNGCIPLAVFRVIHNLEMSAKQYRRLNYELEKSKNIYRDVFENKGSASIICDLDHTIVKANSDFFDLSGYSKNDLIGKSVGVFIDILPFLFLESKKSNKCILKSKKDGEKSCVVHSFLFSNKTGYIISFTDITCQTKAEQALLKYENKKQFLRYYDSLTELPNREYLLLKLREYTLEVLTKKELFASLCIRPAHFNYIEQKHGPIVGNILLKEIGVVFDKNFSDHFCVSKLRGLSFCIVTKSYANEEILKKEIDLIYKQFPQTINISGIEIDVTFYLGVSICPKESTQAEEIIKNSELARDYARTTFARRPIFFNSSFNIRQVEQIEVEMVIKKALEDDRFYMVYQPKVDKKGLIVSAEALVRMDSEDENNIVSPGLFIPVAEKSGLITRIENKIIEMVLSFLSRRIREGKKIVPVSINISGRNIGNVDFASEFTGLLEKYNIPPDYVEIEITETALMIAEELAKENLQKLKKYGISISIDDFGTGYSSLGKLVDLPVDTLKIDKSFLEKIPENLKHVNIISTIINLGTQLNLKIVAEGVETEAQKVFLSGCGCHEFQGYFFYRPLSKNQFERELDLSSFSANENFAEFNGIKRIIPGRAVVLE